MGRVVCRDDASHLERSEFKEKICALLLDSFYDRNYQHGDVAWRNIGFYVSKEGEKLPVLFDLERMSKLEAGMTNTGEDWVSKELARLFDE